MTLVLIVIAGLGATIIWAATGKLSTDSPRSPSTAVRPDTLSPWAIVAALVLPVVGFIIAIVLLAQGRGAHGAAVLLTSVLGAFIGAAIWL